MPISNRVADTDKSSSTALVTDDLSKANQGPQGISFLLEVRNNSLATIELSNRIVELLARGGLDITLMPTDNATAQILSSNPQMSNERQLAASRGEEQLIRWIQDGTLLEGVRIQEAWGVTRQAIDAARDRGEIFSVWVKGQHWYPAEALKFKREDLTAITRGLGDTDPSGKLLFLLHRHGAADGMTPAEAVASRKLGDVLRLAAQWARA